MGRIKSRLTPPHELPPAKLYLDDIEAIVALFQTARSNYPDPQFTKEDSVASSVHFRHGNELFDDVQDLARLGGTSLDFEVELLSEGSYRHSRLVVSNLGVHWRADSLSEDGEWWLSRQLEAVFERRITRWRNAYQNIFKVIPNWAWLVASALIVISIDWNSEWRKMAALKGIGLLLFLAISIGALLVHYFGILRHSVVIFRRSDERIFQLSSEDWRKYIVGAIVGVLGTLAAQILTKLLNKLWP
jgi:hypothetical protein